MQNQQSYTLPTNFFKLERLERNDGTSTYPSWTQMQGWDTYGNALYLESLPSNTNTIRGFLRMKYTDVTDDIINLEIEDDKSEILVWGVVVRAYKMLIGYMKGNISWDGVTAPRSVTLSSLQSYLRDAQKEQKDLIKQYATVSRPRDIDLTG